MALLGNTAFGEIGHPESMEVWRQMVAVDGGVVMRDGDADDVVGQSIFLDLQLTVPGGAVLPTAGLSYVAVAPTHRRRGILRSMYTELHQRIADAKYPIAALTASEGGIYGRFGYGPATTVQEMSIDRRFAEFRAGVPDPGGVRLVKPAEHRDAFAEIYDRWRRQTPGGLVCPTPLWDDVLADRENTREGGSELFAFLHPDGYVLYRVHGEESRSLRVREVTAVTTDAYIALWRALLGMDLMEKVITWTHPDDVLPYLLTNPRLVRVTSSSDDLWVRIMDIPAALEARRYQADLDTVLDVADGFRGDGGRFALRIQGGRAQCTRTDAPADVELDLDVLGSLYLGSHRPEAFVAANRLRSKDPELVRRLGTAFASDVPAELGYGF
ncbi:enhanced intracellular survival protein Eis [Mycolicibacterium sp. HK-90]|uniref:enhanced intracellular survival protein Eis n=1 Tax=Mycolicibacterium sp. HK-90 TaxID=3056937 RepID=UPI002659E55B|nr:enhanced intracellular survival protein Eis [Mycolicibacterium sp. HK-90]WKG06586.1 enhanced intracellular survival protein Eis [Mycolicibacterium sp. HK-90]